MPCFMAIARDDPTAGKEEWVSSPDLPFMSKLTIRALIPVCLSLAGCRIANTGFADVADWRRIVAVTNEQLEGEYSKEPDLDPGEWGATAYRASFPLADCEHGGVDAGSWTVRHIIRAPVDDLRDIVSTEVGKMLRAPASSGVCRDCSSDPVAVGEAQLTTAEVRFEVQRSADGNAARISRASFEVFASELGRYEFWLWGQGKRKFSVNVILDTPSGAFGERRRREMAAIRIDADLIDAIPRIESDGKLRSQWQGDFSGGDWVTATDLSTVTVVFSEGA